MAIQYTEDFKKDAARYWKEHPDLGISKFAKRIMRHTGCLNIDCIQN